MKVPFHIRWMTRTDFPEVLAIEAASYRDPWQEVDFCRALRQRDNLGMVAEPLIHGTPPVVGYFVFWLGKGRFEILNMAVRPDYRRLGVGHAMIQKLKNKLSPAKRTVIEFTVPESNIGAQLFLRSEHFTAVAIERRAFKEADEDGYRFEHELYVPVPELGVSG